MFCEWLVDVFVEPVTVQSPIAAVMFRPSPLVPEVTRRFDTLNQMTGNPHRYRTAN
jgi:hypothetical protein